MRGGAISVRSGIPVSTRCLHHRQTRNSTKSAVRFWDLRRKRKFTLGRCWMNRRNPLFKKGMRNRLMSDRRTVGVSIFASANKVRSALSPGRAGV